MSKERTYRHKGTCSDCGDPVWRLKSKQCRPCWQANPPRRSGMCVSHTCEETSIRASARRNKLDGDEVWESYQAHDGRCDICGGDNGDIRLFMDHDHTSGKFRGWLCNSCNRGIGYLNDDPARLRRAASYLVDSLGLDG